MIKPPDPPIVATGPGRLRRSWPVIRVVVALTAVGVAAWAISGKTDELRSVGGYLAHLRWWWLIVAVVAEIASYGALSSLQRRLLKAGKVRVPASYMLGITMAGAAIQYSFPGGSVIYLAYLFRQFRRWRADDVLSTWVLIAFNVVTFVALAVISAAGLAVAVSDGSTYDLVGVVLGIVAVAGLFTLLIVERKRLLPHVTRTVRLSQRLLHWPAPERPAEHLVAGWSDELAAVSPTPAVWARAGVMGMANWLGDLACLALSFFAVGVGVPWRGLLLAYGAGQLASILPITPGGLGAVEGSITIALVTFGGGTDSTVAAVLLYRLVSFWAVLPVGWGAWGTLALLGRRSPATESGPPALTASSGESTTAGEVRP